MPAVHKHVTSDIYRSLSSVSGRILPILTTHVVRAISDPLDLGYQVEMRRSFKEREIRYRTKKWSGCGDKSSYTANRIFCKLFKEQEICYKTKEILKKNLEKETVLKKSDTKQKRSQLDLNPEHHTHVRQRLKLHYLIADPMFVV